MTDLQTRPPATAQERPGRADPTPGMRGVNGIDLSGVAACLLGLAFAVLLVLGSCAGPGVR